MILCFILLINSCTRPRLLTMPFSVSAITIFVFKNWVSSAFRKLKSAVLSWLTWYNKALNRSSACSVSLARSGRILLISSVKNSRLRLGECRGNTIACCFPGGGSFGISFFFLVNRNMDQGSAVVLIQTHLPKHDKENG